MREQRFIFMKNHSSPFKNIFFFPDTRYFCVLSYKLKKLAFSLPIFSPESIEIHGGFIIENAYPIPLCRTVFDIRQDTGQGWTRSMPEKEIGDNSTESIKRIQR